METKHIIDEYIIRKKQVKSLKRNLDYLERAAEHVKVSSYAEEPQGGYGDIEDIRIDILDQRREIECKILVAMGFISRVECSLESLNAIIGDDYRMFKLRHLEGKSLEQVSSKFGYADPSTIQRRLKKQEKKFERIMNID